MMIIRMPTAPKTTKGIVVVRVFFNPFTINDASSGIPPSFGGCIGEPRKASFYELSILSIFEKISEPIPNIASPYKLFFSDALASTWSVNNKFIASERPADSLTEPWIKRMYIGSTYPSFHVEYFFYSYYLMP